MEYTDFGHQSMINNSMDENLVIDDLSAILSEFHSPMTTVPESNFTYTTEETAHQKILPPPSSCQIFSFGNSHLSPAAHEVITAKNIMYNSHEDNGVHASSGLASKRAPMQVKDHIISERKRREKLNQLFIALSKVLPGIKKLDKVSLLGDAIKYMKELEERKRILEEEVKKTSMKLSFNSSAFDEICTNKGNSYGHLKERRAEIKAKIVYNNVLIKIQCSKQSGIAARIPCEMEKLNLTIHDIRILPFGHTALDISILAEMQSGVNRSAENIIHTLQLAFSNSTWSRHDAHLVHFPN